MEDFSRKLALWHTRTFKPIMAHDDLELIMARLGFVGQPPRPSANGVGWKEYIYASGRCRGREWLPDAATPGKKAGRWSAPPRPKLPYPRIDGLHIITYRAFVDAVGYYVEMQCISEFFHIRAIPVHRAIDRPKTFRRMAVEETLFVYREGSLEPTANTLYHIDKTSVATDTANNDTSGYASTVIRSKDSTSSVGDVASLKDIIVM